MLCYGCRVQNLRFNCTHQCKNMSGYMCPIQYFMTTESSIQDINYYFICFVICQTQDTHHTHTPILTCGFYTCLTLWKVFWNNNNRLDYKQNFKVLNNNSFFITLLALGHVFENVAFFGDLLLHCPDITHKVIF